MTDPLSGLKNQPLAKRLRFAMDGIREGWRRENSFRSQGLAGIAVVALLLVLRPAPIWWAVCALAIVLVLAAELLNAALELLIDHLHPDLHPQIRIVKDMTAGVVLLLSIGAAAVGLLLVLSAF